MKDRTTLGFAADAAESAALTVPDPRATDRIVEALDYAHDRRAEGSRIGAALRRLNAAGRAFAKAVLDGRRWDDLGMPKASFYRELKKVEDFFRRVNTR